MNNTKAFTLASNGKVLNCLRTECGVCLAFDPKSGKEHPKVIKFTAIWDTGAMTSTISEKVIRSLGISPFDFTKVYHADGESIVGKYKVNLLLPNNVAFSAMTVLKGKLHGCDVLIGMDVISRGDFVITNRGNNTIFSFQVPSSHVIDFVAESNARQNLIHLKSVHEIWLKSGNDLCPCNSGKKWKNCHGQFFKGKE